MSFQIGQKLRIKELNFIQKPLHGKTGTVTRIKSFVDHTDGKTYDAVSIELDERVRLEGASWKFDEVTFSSDIYEEVE